MAGTFERPDATESKIPHVQCWDRSSLGVPSFFVIPGSGVQSNRIDSHGFRRYRLKVQVFNTGGAAGQITVRLYDIAFDRLFAWETVAIGPFLGSPIRFAINFGEGTGVLECFMGPWLVMGFFNTGAVGNFLIQSLELWQGA